MSSWNIARDPGSWNDDFWYNPSMLDWTQEMEVSVTFWAAMVGEKYEHTPRHSYKYSKAASNTAFVMK